MLSELINPYYLQVASFILLNIILGVSIYITLATGQLSLGHAGFMSIGAYTSAILTLNYDVPLVLGILIAVGFYRSYRCTNRFSGFKVAWGISCDCNAWVRGSHPSTFRQLGRFDEWCNWDSRYTPSRQGNFSFSKSIGI